MPFEPLAGAGQDSSAEPVTVKANEVCLFIRLQFTSWLISWNSWISHFEIEFFESVVCLWKIVTVLILSPGWRQAILNQHLDQDQQAYLGSFCQFWFQCFLIIWDVAFTEGSCSSLTCKIRCCNITACVHSFSRTPFDAVDQSIRIFFKIPAPKLLLLSRVLFKFNKLN